MNRCRHLLLPVFLAMTAVATEPEVRTLDFATARDAGRITAATWVLRADSYNLQVQLPAPAVRPDQSQYFIGNTIENLRGLDPVFLPGRTLTLVDGRRSATGISQPSLPALVRSSPAMPPGCLMPAADNAQFAGLHNPDVVAPPRPLPLPGKVQVWLLGADGTQILPGCHSGNEITAEYLYRFRLVEGAQAVAVAIQVDGEYYIEKLDQQEPGPAAR